MLSAADKQNHPVFQTQARTEHGLADFWLDGNLDWRVGVEDFEFRDELEQFSWIRAREYLSTNQCERALEASETYLSLELRAASNVLADDSDPTSIEWREVLEWLRPLHRGLLHFLAETDRTLVGTADVDENFGFLGRSYRLDGGRRDFTFGQRERAGVSWRELVAAPTPENPGAVRSEDRRLVDVLDLADTSDRAEIVAEHLDMVRLYGAHLRFLVDKVRAGADIEEQELTRIGLWAIHAINLLRELEAAR